MSIIKSKLSSFDFSKSWTYREGRVCAKYDKKANTFTYGYWGGDLNV